MRLLGEKTLGGRGGGARVFVGSGGGNRSAIRLPITRSSGSSVTAQHLSFRLDQLKGSMVVVVFIQ